MAYHLLTVDHCHVSGSVAYLSPTVRLQRLIADSPGGMIPMRGDAIELRLPDGVNRQANIAVFGIDGWTNDDGYFYTTSDPSDPEFTLSITGVSPDGIPAGTEVWLPGRDGTSTASETNCSYCQITYATARTRQRQADNSPRT